MGALLPCYRVFSAVNAPVPIYRVQYEPSRDSWLLTGLSSLEAALMALSA